MTDGKRQTPQGVWKEFQAGLDFNDRVNLADTVETNENFFVGKQWEGVQSNGLPAPVFNFLKRVVLFQVASVTTDNIKLNASVLGSAADRDGARRIANIVNAEFEAAFEHNNVVTMLREYARNAAVDGDGCMYTYWDETAETGLPRKGAIVTEVLENDRVLFGDPNDRRVQKQPYILIWTREFTEDVKRRAGRCGGDADAVVSDTRADGGNTTFDIDGKTTVVLKLRRDRDDGRIYAFECTQNAVVRPEWDTGLRLYPVTWLNWDYVKDCYHGQAMITGLIPNQIFVNKAYAMSMLSLMSSAYPKTLIDGSRIANWDNRVGGVVRVNGGDIQSAAKILEPAQISPQISQFIDKAVEHTQTFLGATNAALGDTRPDNTSAIIALQRAAAVPSEITRQNLYRSVEELGRIYLDFMASFYGERAVEVSVPSELSPEVAQFAGIDATGTMTETFDFGVLREMPMRLKLDVGASSYWSEVASIQTLSNLLERGSIDIVDFLERIPSGYIADQEKLLAKYRRMQGPAAPAAPAVSAPSPESGQEMQLPMTAGNSQLQRKITNDAMTR